MLPIELIHLHFGPSKKCGSGWLCRCPAHDDKTASLSYSVGTEDRVIMKCHAGCDIQAVLAARGLKLSDLFLKEKKMPGDEKPREVVCRYDYTDEEGKLIYQVERLSPKGFRQRRPDGRGGWLWTLDGVKRVPYNLHSIITDTKSIIIVCEGEKDAENLIELGFLATTAPQGAGKWDKMDGEAVGKAFKDRDVIIIPDNDKPGRAHAVDVAQRLHPFVKSVRIAQLTGLPEHGDVSDWLLSGGDGDKLAELLAGLPNWTPDSPPPQEPLDMGDLVLTNMASVKPQPIEWLWPGVLPIGKLALLIGDPGQGKSLVTMDLAARVTRGIGFPGAEEMRTRPGGVLIVTAEDDLADTIAPRLIAAKANMAQINSLDGVKIKGPDGKVSERMVNIDKNLAQIEKAIMGTPDCRLVIVDPITAFLGDTDSNDNSALRALLAPLGRMASKHKVAMLLVSHVRKSAGKGVHMSLGSLAFTAAARSVWAVVRDPETQDGPRRIVLPIKVNIGPDSGGYVFEIEAEPGGAPTVAWSEERVTLRADSLFGGPEGPQEREGKALKAATAFLESILSGGPVAAPTIKDEARREGIAHRTLHRAADDMGLVMRRQGYPAVSMWSLPQKPPQLCQPPVFHGDGTTEKKSSQVVTPQCPASCASEDGTSSRAKPVGDLPADPLDRCANPGTTETSGSCAICLGTTVPQSETTTGKIDTTTENGKTPVVPSPGDTPPPPKEPDAKIIRTWTDDNGDTWEEWEL